MAHDKSVGRFLSRRDALRLLGGSAVCLISSRMMIRSAAGETSRLCVLRPEQTEGPYFVDERLHRSDIRSDPATGAVKPGMPLALTVALSRVDRGACQPLANAQVDIWHCDALGVYSDVEDPGFSTIGQKFLRGYQVTDSDGEAKFLTIYPGWYRGRTVHIHVKVRTKTKGGGTLVFTSQMYFDDAFSDRIYAAPPYAAKGTRTARNQDDRIFRRGGEQLMLAPTYISDAYETRFAIGLQFPFP
jgi:protocatechuate 3,4-dioxygenase beta subunit